VCTYFALLTKHSNSLAGDITAVNFKNEENDCFVLYNARTMSGSSGSPVFNKDYTSVLALHHHGTDAKEHPDSNRGILTSRILKYLAEKLKAEGRSGAATATGATAFQLPTAKPLESWSSQELAAWLASLGPAYREYANKLHGLGVDGAESVVFFRTESSWTEKLGVPAGLQVPTASQPPLRRPSRAGLFSGSEIGDEVR
jgi:hypothetical protein